MNKKKKSSIF